MNDAHTAHDTGPGTAAPQVRRALVLHPFLRTREEGAAARAPEARLDEAAGLARAIGLEIADARLLPLAAPRPATLIGSGKVEDIAALCETLCPEVVIVDGALSPVQQRNLEKAWKTKVIDRTGLILDIFGARARTREGRLQVELAHLTYQRSRLVRSWTHLERQRGGFGFLGGPGESQIEADRRLIGERIARIRRQLGEVVRTRELHRGARRKVPYPVVALVGYTNAGKSTLFNRLTRADVFAEDLLFATLDPTMRGLVLPDGRRVILSDTVGFISDLPTQLVAAFRATLEEVLEADLILHVRDIAHPDSDAQRADVEAVLGELGFGDAEMHALIEVHNKIDRLDLPAVAAARAGRRSQGRDAVAVSALTGEGIDGLLDLIATRLGESSRDYRLDLPVSDGAGLAWSHTHGTVIARDSDEDAVHLTLRLDPLQAGRFHARFGASLKLISFQNQASAR